MINWIPVTKEMPKEANNYIVTRKNGDNKFLDFMWFNGSKFEEFDSYLNKLDVDNIIAWMPLPEVYEEVAND